MIRIVFLVITGLLVLSGLSLLGSALIPLARQFASLQMKADHLAPLLFRLVGGVFLLGSARWTLQLALRPRE